MTKQRYQCIVSVGSNIAPESNIAKARAILIAECLFLDEATVIQTEPDGFKDQPDFFNGAFLLETDLPYNEFNAYLKSVENRVGRIKGPNKAGPRVIDLDIIIWEYKVVHSDYSNHKHYVVQPINELLQRHAITLQSDSHTLN